MWVHVYNIYNMGEEEGFERHARKTGWRQKFTKQTAGKQAGY
jgi:hypothetical protein